ncbi:NUDIX hydrolase domain-like protein [Xylariaceae sp. AK1471]|nr:NUDIX hydrolase domain-like protein [Xylariaceae sp. AK1471]
MACNGLHPRIGIFAIITDGEDRVLTGKRLNTLGTGQWGFPGGHLEQNEDFFTCVERETLEETGLVVRGIKVVAVTNDKFPEAKKHYVTIFTKCVREDPTQQPQCLESNKCEGWVWRSWGEVKAMADRDSGHEQLFLPMENMVRENPHIDQLISSI